MPQLDALSLAQAWIAAFNAHDVDALVALYAPEATHTSPKIRAQHPETGGRLVGRDALERWWRESNARVQGLRYEPTGYTADAGRVIIEYVRHAPGQADMPVAEAFDVRDGRIVASRVYHG
ncbi:MAG: nuclear transport factor 2 family protein [Deltaproteobacteria bacterium]